MQCLEEEEAEEEKKFKSREKYTGPKQPTRVYVSLDREQLKEAGNSLQVMSTHRVMTPVKHVAGHIAATVNKYHNDAWCAYPLCHSAFFII